MGKKTEAPKQIELTNGHVANDVDEMHRVLDYACNEGLLTTEQAQQISAAQNLATCLLRRCMELDRQPHNRSKNKDHSKHLLDLLRNHYLAPLVPKP